ncbi:MAG: type VI secretion system protein TssA [Polyangia bacterium]
MDFDTRARDYAAALSIDLTALLLPISEDKPAGEWLRYEPLYLKVQEARRADDESLPQGIWKTAPKRADPHEVARLCQSALREQSKDLQLAAWLCEAWARLHGPRGLCVGLLLLCELCARFWDSLYPVLDEDGDASYRLAPIESLDRALTLYIKLLPITEPSLGQDRTLTYADWERAQRNRSDAEHETADGALTTAGFLALAAHSPARAVSTLRTQLHEVLRGAAQLESVIEQKDRRTGPGGPSGGLRDLRAAVAAVLGVLTQLPQLTNEPAEAFTPTENPAAVASTPALPEPSQPAPAVAAVAPARGPIRSRAEAYQRLTEAAEFLLATEPHSPVPYLVRRAVSWGGMSLGQLLDELVQEDSDRRAIFTLLAMREPRS